MKSSLNKNTVLAKVLAQRVAMAGSKPIPIDVVSDTVCPWCYIGKRRLEKAIQKFPDKTFEVRWHPFLLNPAASEEGQCHYCSRLCLRVPPYALPISLINLTARHMQESTSVATTTASLGSSGQRP